MKHRVIYSLVLSFDALRLSLRYTPYASNETHKLPFVKIHESSISNEKYALIEYPHSDLDIELFFHILCNGLLKSDHVETGFYVTVSGNVEKAGSSLTAFTIEESFTPKLKKIQQSDFFIKGELFSVCLQDKLNKIQAILAE